MARFTPSAPRTRNDKAGAHYIVVPHEAWVALAQVFRARTDKIERPVQQAIVALALAKAKEDGPESFTEVDFTEDEVAALEKVGDSSFRRS